MAAPARLARDPRGHWRTRRRAAVLGGIGAAIIPPTVNRIGALDVSLSGGLDEVERWLSDSPLPLTDNQAASVVGELQDAISGQLSALADTAVSGALLTLEVVAGLGLTIVLLFFFLRDGGGLWRWCTSLTPPHRRADVEELGRRSWEALGGFVRGQTVVALFDAVFIGISLAVLGVPLVLPLAVITFFGAYVPIVGATVAGAAAALVALVTEGPATALAVVGAIIVVQQVEGNILQPVVVGRATDVHPVAVLLGVTTGAVLAGIVGAMVAAPTVAVGAAILGYLRERGDDAERARSEDRIRVARRGTGVTSRPV